jgi:hypothetical protein
MQTAFEIRLQRHAGVCGLLGISEWAIEIDRDHFGDFGCEESVVMCDRVQSSIAS